MYYLNNNLKDLVRIFDQNERKNYLRLDLNENPGGLPQDFIDSILPEISGKPAIIQAFMTVIRMRLFVKRFIGVQKIIRNGRR